MMKKLNRSLITIVAVGWLCFLIAGGVIASVFAPPRFTLLVARSYCPPQQWQQVTQNYANLYRQHQQKQIEIERVILFSDLSEETLDQLPTPEAFAQLRTYGRFNQERQNTLMKSYGKTKVLKCP